MARYAILGLDIGPNSIGWALLESTPHDMKGTNGEAFGFWRDLGRGQAICPAMGVRVFDEGKANLNSGKEKALSQERRDARAARRTIERRNIRKRYVIRDLKKAGLLPNEPSELTQLLLDNPIALRAKALDEKLTAHEVGRCLLHLSKRRGFKSNRKSDTPANTDQGLLAEISALEIEIEEGGFRTLGEFLNERANTAGGFANLPRGPEGVRGVKTNRAMYEAEFNAIWDAQAKHHKAMTKQLRETIHHWIFFQHSYALTPERREQAPSRANLHRAPDVKKCLLMPDEIVCQRGRSAAQRFRILKTLANLRVSTPRGKEEPITAEERSYLIQRLSIQKELKFETLRKDLAKGFGREPDLQFNLEDAKNKVIKGNDVDWVISKTIGKSVWGKLSEPERDSLRDALMHAEDNNAFEQAFEAFDLDTKKLDTLRHYEGPNGYSAYSEAALKELLPYFEGQRENGLWVDEHYAREMATNDGKFEVQSSPLVDKLPALSDKSLPREIADVTNPVVRRALVELRKVVNGIVRELRDQMGEDWDFDKHLRIVVEMGRDIKNGTEKRKEINKDQAKLQRIRKRAAAEVARLLPSRYPGGAASVKRDDVNRFLFWEEQGGRCVYTGKSISQSAIFSPSFEVDHILPRWQSLDDSQNNKVLVCADANAAKGQRTPTQWLGEGSEKLEELFDRAHKMTRFKTKVEGYQPKEMPWGKFKRLKQAAVDNDSFVARQLNDTRYIATVLTKYLNLLYPHAQRVGEQRVRCSRGSITALLRHRWGLNGVLKRVLRDEGSDDTKNRDDHRHHAIDAVVVAASSRKLIHRLQNAMKSEGFDKKSNSKNVADEPFDGFWADAKGLLERVVVSHRPRRGLRGALHEATYYGLVRDENGVPIGDRVVSRKSVEALSHKEVNAIRDPAVRGIILKRLSLLAWDGVSKLPENWWQDSDGQHQLFLPAREGKREIRRVRVTTTIANRMEFERAGKIYKVAQLGNNHHLAVYEHPAHEGVKALRFHVVPMAEAARRVRRAGQRAVDEEVHDLEFVLSATLKDTLRVTDPDTGRSVCCVLQTLSGDGTLSKSLDIRIREVSDARVASEGNKAPFARIRSAGAWARHKIEKVQVDPLGRVFEDNS